MTPILVSGYIAKFVQNADALSHVIRETHQLAAIGENGERIRLINTHAGIHTSH
jgi:hypothetical protein